jgi:hypothetical protein
MITSITKEQEALIPHYIKKWVDLASEPIDRRKIKGIFKKVYGKDKTIIIGESFQNTIDLIRVATEGNKLEHDSQLYSQLDSQLRSQLDSQLYSQLYSQLDSQLYSQLRSQLYSQLDSQLRSQLYSQLYSQGIKYSYYCSYYLYDWAGYYDYAEKIGVEFDKKSLKQYFDILLNIPIVVFVGDVIFVCEKPKCRWENGMLHSDQLAAIEWKDNTGFYLLDGVLFEKATWEKVISQTMSFKEIMAIEISDQRTVALKYNPQAILNEGATLIHKDDRTNELYLIEGKDINKELEEPKIWFLKMTCPTSRIFIEGVPPEEAEKNPNATAMQALLCGLTIDEYVNMKLES